MVKELKDVIVEALKHGFITPTSMRYYIAYNGVHISNSVLSVLEGLPKHKEMDLEQLTNVLYAAITAKTIWLNVYEGFIYGYYSKEMADSQATTFRYLDKAIEVKL